MGWQFPIQYANVVGYLTSRHAQAPRLKQAEMKGFLRSIHDGSRIWTSRNYWLDEFFHSVTKSQKIFERESRREYLTDDQSAFFSKGAIARILDPIRFQLSSFAIYGLGIDRQDGNREIHQLTYSLALSTGPFGFFLYPDALALNESALILDPFPGFSKVAQSPENFPGVIFWTKSSQPVFANLDQAQEIQGKILEALSEWDGLVHSPHAKKGEERAAVREFGARADKILDLYRRPNQKSTGVLHLSDLHFGNNAGWRAKRRLLDYIEENKFFGTKATVITGDLVDNPTDEAFEKFNEFQLELERRSRRRSVVIPGNHDQKWFGLAGRNFKMLADIRWREVAIDPEAKIVFCCFDTSRDENLAKGLITKEQRDRVLTLLAHEEHLASEIKDYLRIALIHHHPFSFDVVAETPIQRVLSFFGVSDERFLKMEEADEFVAWCANARLPLILHGHKHIPRHVQKKISIGVGSTSTVTAIGCGSSMGAESTPLSFNVVSWDPIGRNWAASFFQDIGDGSGFVPQAVAINHL